jgi:hypothetical protein
VLRPLVKSGSLTIEGCPCNGVDRGFVNVLKYKAPAVVLAGAAYYPNKDDCEAVSGLDNQDDATHFVRHCTLRLRSPRIYFTTECCNTVVSQPREALRYGPGGIPTHDKPISSRLLYALRYGAYSGFYTRPLLFGAIFPEFPTTRLGH